MHGIIAIKPDVLASSIRVERIFARCAYSWLMLLHVIIAVEPAVFATSTVATEESTTSVEGMLVL